MCSSDLVVDIHRHRLVIFNRVDKLAELFPERLHVPFEEEIQRFIAADRFRGSDADVCFSVVFSDGGAFRPEVFDALVVTVRCLAAVIDDADRAVGEAERDYGRVDIAGGADRGVDGDGGRGENLYSDRKSVV